MASEASIVPPEADRSENDTQHSADAAVYTDDIYCIRTVTLRVENCLFRVSKRELEQQSTMFREMFAKLLEEDGKDGEPKGTSDSNPIHLNTVKKDTFKVLLSVLYSSNPEAVCSVLSFDQCASLYKFLQEWDFGQILNIVKKHIRHVLWDTISCDDRIKFIHDNKIEEWYALADVHYELAMRTKPLSIEEGRKLGLEFSIKLGHVREEVAKCRGDGVERGQVARKAIDEIFFDKRCSNSMRRS